MVLIVWLCMVLIPVFLLLKLRKAAVLPLMFYGAWQFCSVPGAVNPIQGAGMGLAALAALGGGGFLIYRTWTWPGKPWAPAAVIVLLFLGLTTVINRTEGSAAAPQTDFTIEEDQAVRAFIGNVVTGQLDAAVAELRPQQRTPESLEDLKRQAAPLLGRGKPTAIRFEQTLPGRPELPGTKVATYALAYPDEQVTALAGVRTENGVAFVVAFYVRPSTPTAGSAAKQSQPAPSAP